MVDKINHATTKMDDWRKKHFRRADRHISKVKSELSTLKAGVLNAKTILKN